MILLTGGAGFIGSAFVRAVHEARSWPVVVLDALTYAGNLNNLVGLTGDLRFVHASVCDAPRVRQLLADCRPRAIVHMAAESHVDRSIVAPGASIGHRSVQLTDLVQTLGEGPYARYLRRLPTEARS